jgi:hypothetical protein
MGGSPPAILAFQDVFHLLEVRESKNASALFG